MLAFDQALADLEPEEFVQRVLVDALGARVVLAGSDFRFGREGRGRRRPAARARIAVGVRRGADRRCARGEDRPGASERRASSTWIREVLDAGRVRRGVARARSVTRRCARSSSRGEQRGRELGYPTANLDPAALEGFLPADGVYAAWATVDGVRYPAAVSIGNNPTFDGVPQHQVEAHLLDVDLDLYGRTIELEFVDFVRGMEKFDSLEQLIEKIRGDADEARRILAEHP